MTWAQPINLNGAVEEDRFDDWSARPPNVDLDRLCRDQGVTGDLSKLRKYRLDLLACIDGLDHEGEILRKTEYVGCMENGGPPVSGDTAENRRTRDSSRLQGIDDRFLEGVTVMAAALTEVHPEQPTVQDGLHGLHGSATAIGRS